MRRKFARSYNRRKAVKRTRYNKFLRNYVPSFVPKIIQTNNDLSIFGFTNGVRAWPTGGGSYQELTFSLDMLPDWPSIQALYDQYRIKWVKVTLLPTFNSSDENMSGQSGCISSIIDNDSATGISTDAEMGEYKSYRATRSYRTHSRFLRPTPLREIYKSTISTAYETVKYAPWLDTNNPDVPHYGMSIFIDGGNVNAGLQIKIKMCVECKNTK